MNYILDAVIALVLLLFVLMSIKRGFAAELRGVTGWVIILLLSLRFGALVGDYMAEHIEHISMASTYVGFIVLAVILKLIFMAISQLFESNEFGFLDKLFSGITGLIKGGLLISIVFIILASTPAQEKVQPYIDTSISYRYLYGFSTAFVDVLTRFVPQLETLYERMLDRSSEMQKDTSKTIQEKVETLRKRNTEQKE
ncbi:MAG: CvpA family protein [candidate division KSB1 bacterium]|nr:CvpA family protein [candidate division KSB1 bacterium]